MKKIISMLLVLVMSFSVFGVTASATEIEGPVHDMRPLLEDTNFQSKCELLLHLQSIIT